MLKYLKDKMKSMAPYLSFDAGKKCLLGNTNGLSYYKEISIHGDQILT